MAKPRSIRAVGQRLRVLHHLPGVGLEVVGQRFTEGHRLGRDDVLQRTALGAGEHRLVDRLGVLDGAENEAGARAAQRLVGRTGDHLRMRNRRGVDPAGNQPGEVRHVHQEERAYLVRDGAEGREVDDAGVGAAAGDDESRPFLSGLIPHLVVIDQAGGGIHAVVDRAPDRAAVVDRRAVGQMAAVRQRHAHQQLARSDQRHEGGEVGLRTRVGLHVGVLRAEQLLQPIDGQLLDLVDDLAPAVVPFARADPRRTCSSAACPWRR